MVSQQTACDALTCLVPYALITLVRYTLTCLVPYVVTHLQSAQERLSLARHGVQVALMLAVKQLAVGPVIQLQELYTPVQQPQTSEEGLHRSAMVMALGFSTDWVQLYEAQDVRAEDSDACPAGQSTHVAVSALKR